MKRSDIAVTVVAFLVMLGLGAAIESQGRSSSVSLWAAILVGNALLIAYPVFAGIRARSPSVAVCLGFVFPWLVAYDDMGAALALGGICSAIALVAALATLAIRRRRARRLGKPGPAVVLRHEMKKLALIAPMFVFGFMAYWAIAWYCADHHISMAPTRGLFEIIHTLGEPAFCNLAIVGSIAFPLYTVLYFTVLRRLGRKRLASVNRISEAVVKAERT